jgi:uncharacterized protein YmfQ (DUF2313 family)
MDTYQSMRNNLRKTGMYSLNGNTLVDRELLSYAESLNAVVDEVRKLQSESFIATSSNYGLTQREQDYGLSPCGTAEDRRKSLMFLSAVNSGSFTKNELEKQAKEVGLDVKLEEKISERKIIVHFLKNPNCGKDAAQKKLENIIPCHLALELDFSSAL